MFTEDTDLVEYPHPISIIHQNISKFLDIGNKCCDKSDAASRKLVTNAFEGIDYEVDEFKEHYFPLDLYARKNGMNYTVIEVKSSKFKLNAIANGPCKGAFVSERKIRSLCASIHAMNTYAILAYVIEDIVYYILWHELLQYWSTKREYVFYQNTERERIDVGISIPVEKLQQYAGINSLKMP